MRSGLRRLLVWFMRLYLQLTPISRGRRFLTETFVMPCLPPPPNSYTASLPRGGEIDLLYLEAIGLTHFVYGGFERAEVGFVQDFLSEGQRVVDVGANVGYFTVPMALKVGAGGCVVACEPEPGNLDRLHKNVSRNGLRNVDIRPTALGSYDGETTLRLGDDSAYHTTASTRDLPAITVAHETGEEVRVPVMRLDTLWEELGTPSLDLIKIDVEGAELGVLKGGVRLLREERPWIMLETQHFEHVAAFLRSLNYAAIQPSGFVIENFVFAPR
jgi:FkbM family methyltransferase